MMAKTPPWQLVSRTLGVRPHLSTALPGALPIYVERYLIQTRTQSLPALSCPVVVVHLGGSSASGGSVNSPSKHYLPSVGVVVPPDTPSAWQFEGAVDAALFYFHDMTHPKLRGLSHHLRGSATVTFSDALLSGVATNWMSELAQDAGADRRFLQHAATLFVLQLERVLSGRAGRQLIPRHMNLSRLRTALSWIDQHLDQALDNHTLAKVTGVSEPYFRQMFRQAMPCTAGRYVQQRRLERARELLASTELPIAQIAAACGYISQSYLTTCFRQQFKLTPAAYRRVLQT
jgi:AraC family transcriptional regulator